MSPRVPDTLEMRMKMYAELRLKFCKICKIEKSVDLFYKDKRRKNGLAYECKDCKKMEVAKSRIKNPERWKAKRHRNMIKEKFGLHKNDYDMMYKKQNEKCAICEIHQNNLDKKLFVDHCHSSDKIRGLLCQKCNFMIGLANDSQKILYKAIEYLEKFKK